ncbi:MULTISPECIES: MarR family winged helix-turn-helix transcriptional regulator [Nocardiopsidaceae]|uniref:MarR family transcriptional regulator n=2 Tax=Nocardiopsidaceae TaxID=83676 RepID=A0ABY6YSX0_9ACTN|nr:MarR family transcriptional regulator [Streptomonospora nanhaiensis]WAE75465.1 MarR family transcriptional regulator [Streptomonospora nanhaiensis]
MTTTTPDSGPGTTLGWSLAVVLRRWHELTEASLTDIPHGSRGYHVLTAAVHAEPPTQAALAERLLIDRSVMTYLLDDLEEAGLVRRRVDPGDRRVRRVCATERGREVLAGARDRVDRVEERVLAGVDEPARALFRASALRAATSIQESSPTTDPCLAVREVVGGGDGPAGGRGGGRARRGA